MIPKYRLQFITLWLARGIIGSILNNTSISADFGSKDKQLNTSPVMQQNVTSRLRHRRHGVTRCRTSAKTSAPLYDKCHISTKTSATLYNNASMAGASTVIAGGSVHCVYGCCNIQRSLLLYHMLLCCNCSFLRWLYLGNVTRDKFANSLGVNASLARGNLQHAGTQQLYNSVWWSCPTIRQLCSISILRTGFPWRFVATAELTRVFF